MLISRRYFRRLKFAGFTVPYAESYVDSYAESYAELIAIHA
jgi:hypothetical protein